MNKIKVVIALIIQSYQEINIKEWLKETMNRKKLNQNKSLPNQRPLKQKFANLTEIMTLITNKNLNGKKYLYQNLGSRKEFLLPLLLLSEKYSTYLI